MADDMPDDLTDFGLTRVPLAEKARRVAGVFTSVAERYDVMNDIMSLGSHRLMKRFAVEMAAIRAGDTVLDLAGGTGDLAALLAREVGAEGRVTLCDINLDMIEVGRNRLTNKGFVSNIDFVQADAEQLPFPNESFEAITIAFGLRNVTTKERALSEMHRVLKSAGRLVVLEFSHPRTPVVRAAYDAFSSLWPRIGKAIVDDADSYRYLVESIKVHPDQETLKSMITEAGFTESSYHNLADGIAAIHIGRKA